MLDQKKKDLSQYRLEHAEEFLEDARTLFKQGSYRSSNNRAYYSIFHAMRAIFALDGVEYKKHSGNITYFLKGYVKTGVFETEISDIILSASRIRTASDYDDFYIASRAETLRQIQDAEKFIAKVKEYLTLRIQQEEMNQEN